MKRKKRRMSKLFKMILLQIVIICMIVIFSKHARSIFQMDATDREYFVPTDSPAVKTSANTRNQVPLITLNNEQIISHNAILVRLSDKSVILKKKSSEIINPASLTKIMTAIVAMEQLDNLDQPITLSSSMFQKLYNEDASMAGFLPDETVTAKDLLYGVLLPSGAECCIGLANHIAGSEDNFVALMNEKARKLGLEDTHFTNVTGLTNKDHYTTVADLAKLLEYALQNDTFREIFTSPKHSTAPTSLHLDGITFYSTMFAKMTSPDFEGGKILGGKTGYTSKAGLCLASLAQKDGREYILVTAGAKGNHDTKQYNIADAFKIYNELK